MAQNYVLLERIELNASAASVTFSNIPQSGYTDLKLVMSARNDGAQYYGEVYFNGNTTGYSRRLLYGDGSSAGSLAASNDFTLVTNPSTSYTANTFGNFELYIPNYTGSANKSFSIDAVIENNATTAYATLYAGLWSNTAAITSVTLDPDSGNFVQYSTFSLYGLAAVGTTPSIAPKASGGNITTDGTYWIHTFNSTGTFTPFTGLTCDYLVVAGGGSGSSGGDAGYYGGGGGAGGFRTNTGLSVTAQSYTVTVGAGGAAQTTASSLGNKGSNSVFSTITATGGGAGQDPDVPTGNATGGSGGGSNYTGAGAGNEGSYSPVEGFAGGPGVNGDAAGGGGGASAVGATATSTAAGAGGAGSSNSYSGSAVTYAGGGGGGGLNNGNGAGGAGGGGAGAKRDATAATTGTVNTGGGGGGGSRSGASINNGAAGGSGIVIIRYLAA